MKTRSQLSILLFVIILSFEYSYGQSYGLGFYSHEVVQDQRTGLDLSPGKTLCFNNSFDISFDLTFLPSRSDYFGYIVRFVGSNNQNIDLIYDKNLQAVHHFKIIIGDKFSKIAFNIPVNLLFTRWNTVRFKFDYDKKMLTVSSGKFSSQTFLDLKRNDCFKILFGANEYLGFKTTDIPPMKIRNVGISEEGKMRYHWSLDEYDGSIAREDLNNKDAKVINPLWVKKSHYNWQLLKTSVVNGPASVAFDAKKEIVHIIGFESLFNYSVKTDKMDTINYASGKHNLLRGNQSLFNNKIINFYIDQKVVSVFNQDSRKWTENFDPNLPITDFWLFNKFYSPIDSSLYMVGGYGHFFYRNQIQRYHFPSRSWKDITVSGDTLTPRYLAALGQTDTGAYILGGYGSSSGQQMLNPRNLYDLLYFDVRKKTIKKIYELKIKGEDFVFANSLVINEKTKKYYALIFPKHKYKSNLQLIEGSLTRPEFKLSATHIPYLFHDINSFADLFYCAERKQFIAVTMFRNENNQTTVNLYTLSYPAIDNKQIQIETRHRYFYLYIISIILLIGAIAGFLIFRKRTKKRAQKPPFQPLPVIEDEPEVITELKNPATEHKNSIFLFGDLQVFDKEGNEITKQFTPLIKELFLVILLYTIRWERGISSEKLKELLWFDKSEESARNNRSVNIAKLKSIMDKMDNYTVSKETGYWKINVDFKNAYIDYHQYVTIIKDKKRLNKQKISELAELIKRGPFLPNINYEWMDSFKAEVSNEIIDTYLHFAHSIPITDDPELLVELANYIFYFDSVNEEAMVIKCKALVHLGKHSQSKNTYENFCKEYKLLYNDDFDKSFSTVLNSDPFDSLKN